MSSQRHLPGWEPNPADAHGYWPGYTQNPKRRKWVRYLLLGCVGCLALPTAVFILLLVLAAIVAPRVRQTGTASPKASCAPQPCAVEDGVLLLISDVNRAYQPRNLPDYAQKNATPRPGFHWVRLQVTFIDQQGEHEVSPYSVDLRDALGYQQAPGGLLFDPACQSVGGSALALGGRLGPTPICFEAGGDPKGSLTVVWIPSGLTGPQRGAELPIP